MTAEETIEIIKAAQEGKTIEVKYKGPNSDLSVDWYVPGPSDVILDGICSDGVISPKYYDYRVKIEPTVIPYSNVEELLSDLREHGPMVKDKGTYRIVKKVTPNGDGSLSISLSGMKECCYELLQRKDLTWQDGAPFGKLNLE